MQGCLEKAAYHFTTNASSSTLHVSSNPIRQYFLYLLLKCRYICVCICIYSEMLVQRQRQSECPLTGFMSINDYYTYVIQETFSSKAMI